MKAFAVLIGLLVSTPAAFPQQPPPVEVAKFSWAKERIGWEKDPFSPTLESFREMQNRVRTERRPTSALEERSIRASKDERDEKKKNEPPPRYVFRYKMSLHNVSTKAIKEIDWDYVFFDATSGEEIGRREFTSVESIGAGKRKDLSIMISSPPTSRISVHSLTKNERDGLIEKIFVLRILYEDDSVWPEPGTP